MATTERAPGPEDLRLARYHDGELGPAEAAGVKRRLVASPDAATTLAWYRRLGDALRSGLPGVFPAGVGEAVMRRIRSGRPEDHPLVSLFPLMCRLAAAAAVLTTLAAAGFWWQRGRAEPRHLPRLVSVERGLSLGRVTMEIRAPAPGRLLRE